MRIRPRSDAPFEYVPVEHDDLDPALDTFGIEPAAVARYRQIAQEQSKRGRALERDSELRLASVGASSTFPSPKAATRTFMENNAHFFDDPSFEDVDAIDVTADFMDRIDVRSGNRYVKLSRTPRGEAILRGDGYGGAAIARAMLTYLFGQAGNRRRWRDVPWALIDEYVGALRKVMADDASRRGARQPSSGGFWYPLASGVYAPAQMLAIATEELGEENAKRLADWLNSQELYELADRLTRVLSPPKGPAGRAGRRARKCLGKDARKTVAARRRQIEQWAAYPTEIPYWTCVGVAEASGVGIGASLCMFPGLETEVRKVERACDDPYDPDWPSRERERLCQRGQDGIEQFGSGVAPLGCEDVLPEPELDLPWESNPSQIRYEVEQSKSSSGGRWHLRWHNDAPEAWPPDGLVKKFSTKRSAQAAKRTLEHGSLSREDATILVEDDIKDDIRKGIYRTREDAAKGVVKYFVVDMSNWGIPKPAWWDEFAASYGVTRERNPSRERRIASRIASS